MPGTQHHIDRRSFLATAAVLLAGSGLARPAAAQSWEGLPFDFDALSEVMRQRAGRPYEPPKPVEGPLTDLNYQLYRLISFDPERARFADGGSDFRLHAFHPGWLFKEPVTLYEVVDGTARPMVFGPEDFRYFNEAAEFAERISSLPGISGFRLH
jgi:glucans biosynthesis protein